MTQGVPVQSQAYYPFGLPMEGTAYHRSAGLDGPPTAHLYQGKELQREKGLDWYDFHARQYDPAIGRFLSADPQHQFYSPYIGMGNSPVMMVDPDGEFVVLGSLLLGKIIIGAVIGAGISSAAYTTSIAVSDGGFDNWNWGDLGKSAAIGAITGAATAGVSSAFGGPGGSFTSTSTVAGETITKTSLNPILGSGFLHETARSLAVGATNGFVSNLSLQAMSGQGIDGNLLVESTLYGIGGGLLSGFVDTSPLASKVFAGHHSVKHVLRSTAYQIGGNLASRQRIGSELTFGLDASLAIPAFADGLALSSPLLKNIAKKKIDTYKEQFFKDNDIIGSEHLQTTVDGLKADLYTNRKGIFSLFANLDIEMKGNFRIRKDIPLMGGYSNTFNPTFSIRRQSIPLYFNARIFNQLYLNSFR